MSFTILGLGLAAISLVLLLAGLIQKARIVLNDIAEDDIAIGIQRYLDQNRGTLDYCTEGMWESLESGLRTHLPVQERAYLFWWGVYSGAGTAIYWVGYLVVYLISN